MDTSKIEVVFQAPSGAPKDNSMIDLFMALAWPIAIILVILLLRKPISELFRNMGSRFTKLSVGAFAIELAAASAQSKSIAALDDIRDTASHASVADSSSALIQSLREDTSADYAIVNLGDGQEWLTSRLYLATSIVPRM